MKSAPGLHPQRPDEASRVLGLLPNENVNEPWGEASGGRVLTACLASLQVDAAQRVCGLASPDWPLRKSHLSQNGRT